MEYWGLASTFDVDSNTNTVDTVKSKYLPVYLAADQRNYMVSNSGESISLVSFFKGLWNKIFFNDVDLGTGLIHLNQEAVQTMQIDEKNADTILSQLNNKVQINRLNKEILLTRNGQDANQINDKGVETYRYKLKYWLEKYATPVDFYIALHTATGAPEFVSQMAQNPAQGDGVANNKGEPRLTIGTAQLVPNRDYTLDIVYLDLDPRTYKVRTETVTETVTDPETGQTSQRTYEMPVFLTMDQVKARLNSEGADAVVGLTGNTQAQAIIQKAEAFDASNLTVFTPYIAKVMNHWYYKEIIFQDLDKNIDVYRMERLPETAQGRVRYQMYTAIQIPGYGGVNEQQPSEVTPTENGNTSNGTSGENASGGNGSGGSSNTSVNSNVPAETSTGDDRAELAAATQLPKATEESGFGFGSFFDSILDLIKSAQGLIGSFAGITGTLAGIPSAILNGSYNQLGTIFNSVTPTSLLNNISNGLVSGLGYYSGGIPVNIGNMNQYLNYGSIANSLGLGQLQSTLSASNIMNKLGLDKVNSALIDASRYTNVNMWPSLAANALDKPELTGVFSGVTGMLQNGVNSRSLVDTMYSGISTQVKDELGSQILSSARQAFYGVSSGEAPVIAAGLIGGFATDLVNRTTGEFFNGLQQGIQEQLGGIYNVQIEQLLQNENAKQMTGLNIYELQSLSSVPNLDYNKIEQANEDITKIQASVEESTKASRELSSLVNEMAQEYAGIDAVTFYYLAKNIREILSDLDIAERQIDTFEEQFKNYEVSERMNLQITTNISRAREAIANARTSINALEVSETRTYGKNLATAGTEIARIIDENKSKLSAVTAALLIAQGNATSDILSPIGENVQRIDVNTINNIKAGFPNMKLAEFLDFADKLAEIEPNLNGLADDIAKLDNELKDINEENSSELVNKVEQYENKIDNLNWLTKSRKEALKAKARTLKTNVNNVNNNVLNASLPLINAISGQVTGITTYKINTLANQVLNLPNAAVSQLLNTARQVPTELVRELSTAFTQKVAEAVVADTKAQLTEKVKEGLTETVNSNGELNRALQYRDYSKRDAAKMQLDGEDQPLVDSKDEILTGFFIRETRINDYMQKSEPVLIPYGFEHWKKLFIDNKYLLTGDYGEAYNMLMQQANTPEEKAQILENQAYVAQYGKSIWEGTGGNLEETIYAELQSMPSVDSQYLLRYFKELFANYGDELREAATKAKISTSSTVNQKHEIGWIFKTRQVTEIVNTGQLGGSVRERLVNKADYEPVNWTKSNSGTLFSQANDQAYGFREGLDIVSPATAVVVSKTEGKINELKEKVLPTITLQIQSSDPYTNGMRIILRGGDYSQAVVGSTVTKDTVIGKTTSDNIMILVLNAGSHAQVDDVSQYIYPPYTTVNGAPLNAYDNQQMQTNMEQAAEDARRELEGED